MPLSYTELSTYQLLCIREAYQLIDTMCAERFTDWDIVDFEKSVVNGFSQGQFDESAVRSLIGDGLRRLDADKPLKRYLEPGQHSAYELFLSVPEINADDVRPFRLFWAYTAREYGDAAVPIEKARCREIYKSVLKHFGMRLYSHNDFDIERFSADDKPGYIALLLERDLRQALFAVEHRNQAYSRKTCSNGESAYLDKAVEKLGALYRHICPEYILKEDFNVHDLCFAIDSSCTELQRDNILLLWGVFTGKPLSLAECGRQCGVTGSRVLACENTLIRNVGHQCRDLLAVRFKN